MLELPVGTKRGVVPTLVNAGASLAAAQLARLSASLPDDHDHRTGPSRSPWAAMPSASATTPPPLSSALICVWGQLVIGCGHAVPVPVP